MISSATASVDRNTRTPLGTRLPSSAMMPKAKAMSVAVGTPQPWEVSGLAALKREKMTMGARTPPQAAIMGRAAWR